MSGSPSDPWTTASLVVIDLEGTGAQDRDDEAILEIALVPLVAGLPDMPASYTTLINPGRPIGARPWLSPGLTDTVLCRAAALADIEPYLADRINGHYLVGHNVSVDWRLLHRQLPAIRPAGLIDTLRLARALTTARSRALNALIHELGLTGRVNAAAPDSQPHRALWDTTATALLLPELVTRRWPTVPTLGKLLAEAALPLNPEKQPTATAPQPALF
ncbi:3'-5' exonuclease [Micromonospora chersina]|uniref:3'-5' exonuclease n=1 Tax=Micromonospora chersina TaxID=47854 RepID=UPI0033E3B3E6